MPPLATSEPGVTPAPAPSIELAWGDGVQVSAEIGADRVAWSPTSPRLAAYLCMWSGQEMDGVYIASSPGFAPTRLSPDQAECWGDVILPPQLLWTQDGQRVAFSGLWMQTGTATLNPENISLVNADGASLQTLDVSGRSMALKGWMDSSTLISMSYGGGGTWDVWIVDTLTGNTINPSRRVGGVYPPSSALIPVRPIVPFPRAQESAFALTRLGAATQRLASRVFGEAGNVRFEDWSPGGTSMLLLTWEADKDLLDGDAHTALETWDLTSGAMRVLALGGVHGRFSPDGKQLAIIAPHPLVIDASGHIQGANRSSDEAQLYLMEVATETVSAIAGHPQLNIADLEQFGGERPALLSWSPDGRRLVFRGTDLQWTVLDLGNQELTPITLSGGQTLIDPQWSFDSRYLSLTLPAWASDSDEAFGGRTYIMEVP
jgi:hypothetical protein